MKRNCKTCTLNTTNDTVETCKRMCYLRYSKQRKKRICDLEQEIQQLKVKCEELKKHNFDYNISCTRFEEYVKCLEQKLERIEEYCKEQNLKADYTACEILQIIDEVE